MSDYILFLDETGHHGLKAIDQQFPILLLCGFVIEKEYYLHTLIPQFEELKTKYFDSKEIVFHSRDIRKWQYQFKCLGEPLKRQDFYNDIDDMIKNAQIHVISAAILKNKLIGQYGPQANNPYDLSLTFILERTVFLTDRLQCSKVEVIAEARGKVEDAKLHQQFQVITNNGTQFVNRERFSQRFSDIDFKKKSENIIGTQLSDLIAYPIATKILYPERENFAFRIIEPKLYRQFNNGDYLGYGLKIFP